MLTKHLKSLWQRWSTHYVDFLDMTWQLVHLTWEIHLRDQKGILLCCRGADQRSVIRPLWWVYSEIGLKYKVQHIQTPSKHSMKIFVSTFPRLLDRKYLYVLFGLLFSNLWFQIPFLLLFTISSQFYRNFYKTKSLFFFYISPSSYL